MNNTELGWRDATEKIGSIECPHCGLSISLSAFKETENDVLVADGNECPYCFKPFHQGLCCISCEREFCPECHLEMENGECSNCSYEGIVAQAAYATTIKEFAKQVQRLMVIERETLSDGLAMDSVLNFLHTVSNRKEKNVKETG